MWKKKLPLTAQEWLDKSGLPWESPAPRIKTTDVNNFPELKPGSITCVENLLPDEADWRVNWGKVVQGVPIYTREQLDRMTTAAME